MLVAGSECSEPHVSLAKPSSMAVLTSNSAASSQLVSKLVNSGLTCDS
jgi:hypothetical protein